MKPEEMVIYAWVGEDELGSGEMGIKQGLTPAGMIPLVSISRQKLCNHFLPEQLKEQVKTYGKTISLVQFIATKVIHEIKP